MMRAAAKVCAQYSALDIRLEGQLAEVMSVLKIALTFNNMVSILFNNILNNPDHSKG